MRWGCRQCRNDARTGFASALDKEMKIWWGERTGKVKRMQGTGIGERRKRYAGIYHAFGGSGAGASKIRREDRHTGRGILAQPVFIGGIAAGYEDGGRKAAVSFLDRGDAAKVSKSTPSAAVFGKIQDILVRSGGIWVSGASASGQLLCEWVLAICFFSAK